MRWNCYILRVDKMHNSAPLSGADPMTVPKAKSPRGFTIVELLIVIAIISFIAALLLPALTGAKNRGKGADCISRLRQIGIGFRLWANDNEGYFPWSVEASRGGSGLALYFAFGGDENA